MNDNERAARWGRQPAGGATEFLFLPTAGSGTLGVILNLEGRFLC